LKRVLFRKSGEIGSKIERNKYCVTTWEAEFSDVDALLMNEVIYDRLFE